MAEKKALRSERVVAGKDVDLFPDGREAKLLVEAQIVIRDLLRSRRKSGGYFSIRVQFGESMSEAVME